MRHRVPRAGLTAAEDALTFGVVRAVSLDHGSRFAAAGGPESSLGAKVCGHPAWSPLRWLVGIVIVVLAASTERD